MCSELVRLSHGTLAPVNHIDRRRGCRRSVRREGLGGLPWHGTIALTQTSWTDAGLARFGTGATVTEGVRFSLKDGTDRPRHVNRDNRDDRVAFPYALKRAFLDFKPQGSGSQSRLHVVRQRRRLDHRSRDDQGAERPRSRTDLVEDDAFVEPADRPAAIASNIGSIGASAYLQFITNAFVNGNAANANWTGGAAKPVKLGNLAAGYTVTQLNELTGKWFLGTDLPTSTVSMSGASNFSVKYSTVTSPLYGASGPSMSDINQGYLGDCYLLASLAEVANQDPSAITSMIANNGNGTYGVLFHVNGAARYVTVDAQLANGGTEFNHATNIWASLVEQAYAEVQAQGVITGNSVNDGNSFSTIGNGGAPE